MLLEKVLKKPEFSWQKPFLGYDIFDDYYQGETYVEMIPVPDKQINEDDLLITGVFTLWNI